MIKILIADDHAVVRSGLKQIVATATDISTGSRLGFTQSDFDLLCSDVDTVPLSRAAAASSAVPLVLSPVGVRRARQN